MVQAFDCAALVRVVADSVEVLRRCDVFCVLESAADWGGSELSAMAEWLGARRPDLAGEIAECCEELGCF